MLGREPRRFGSINWKKMNDLAGLAIKRLGIRTIYGEPVRFFPKKFNYGQVIGGLLFGFGWAMTGACPGPLYALIGSGVTVIAISLLSAIAGTWVYGLIREKLPH